MWKVGVVPEGAKCAHVFDYLTEEPLHSADGGADYDFTLAAIVFGTSVALNLVDTFVNGYAKREFQRTRATVRTVFRQFRVSVRIEPKQPDGKLDESARQRICQWRTRIRTIDHRIYRHVIVAKCLVKALMGISAVTAVICMIHPCTQRWIALLLLPYPCFRFYCFAVIECWGRRKLKGVAREIHAATQSLCFVSAPSPLGGKTKVEIRRVNMALYVISSRFVRNRSKGFRSRVSTLLTQDSFIANVLSLFWSAGR